ncbi:PREDICTED: fibroblast growth factor receptor-like [Priapulus caudatus]|uniref:Fibroblast growth factor receptor-like n=1 Tax=Priapulus caudatus TaxID=37621 RepID=A0ABM1EGD6_PRICU|nr:PREDICTED: fibroblast growth factor receptor-like [Priapulus caudatus]
MRYLHQQQVVHRDLAARNVLVFKDDWVKITDFGLSRQVESDYYMLQTRRGLPLLWTAPEVKDDNRFYKESDVWSYGVTLWEVFSDGTDPIIQHDGDPSGSGTMLANHTAFLRHGERLPNIDGCAERVYALMQRCWQWDKHMRPTFPQIVDEVSQWRGALLGER